MNKMKIAWQASLLVLFLGTIPAWAQQQITCSSNNGRAYCRADTSRGVQMANQRSGSPCRQGYSWGYDNGGIWVDKGCRADFVLGQGGGRPGNWGGNGGNRPGFGGGGQQQITCSSNNGREYCRADTSRGVQMVNQRSGSPCRQNDSWGYDRGGIWVDKGCRADFVLGGGMSNGGGWNGGGNRPGFGGGNGGRPGGGNLQQVTCSSNDGRSYCKADTSRGVQMVNQRSGSPCRQNYSWGYDRGGIWVDHGCRADFVLGGGGR